MRRALSIPAFGTFGDVHLLVDLAREAEDKGWDGVFLWDHLLYDGDGPVADPWIVLAAMAAATERIRLGPLVTPIPRRRPWKVAREAVTLDHLSRGRLVLGVGLGIDFWNEFGAFSGEAADDSTRADLLDDGLEIIRRLWSGEPATYQGRRLSVDGARFLPRPLQQPRIPIWSGALWPLRPGPARRAAGCDGIVPLNPGGVMTPDDVKVLKADMESRRRANKPFDICVAGPFQHAGAFEEAGATWLIEGFWPQMPLADARRAMADRL